MNHKVLLASFTLSLLIVGCKEVEKKEAPIEAGKAQSIYSDTLNNQFKNLLNAYFSISEAFVNWDTTKVGTEISSLQTTIAQLNFTEIKTQDSIFKAAEADKAILADKTTNLKTATSLEGKRRAFQQISETLKHLVETIKYDSGDLYLMKCPMAFNDDETAYWLSQKDEIRNPYLGTKHPKYKATMLSCGSNEGRIDTK